MPEFSKAFRGMCAKRTLTHSELVRAVRYMIAAEYEAIQLYEQLAESTDNKLARKVLMDVANEEKEHVGEFRRLLSVLAPHDEAHYCSGMKEAEKSISELHAAMPDTPCSEPPCCEKEPPHTCKTAK